MVVRGGSGGGSGGGYSSGSSGSSGGGGGAGLLGARLRYIWILRAPTIIRCLSLCVSPSLLLLSPSSPLPLPPSPPLALSVCVHVCLQAHNQPISHRPAQPSVLSVTYPPHYRPPLPKEHTHTHTHTHNPQQPRGALPTSTTA